MVEQIMISRAASIKPGMQSTKCDPFGNPEIIDRYSLHS
jgi:hypothetical protein